MNEIAINQDNVMEVILEKGFAQRRNWKNLILFIACSIPGEKYVSKLYFEDILEKLGLNPHFDQRVFLSQLSALTAEGFLEKKLLALLGTDLLTTEAEKLIAQFVRQNVIGPCNRKGMNKTQAVYRIAAKGREHVRSLGFVA